MNKISLKRSDYIVFTVIALIFVWIACQPHPIETFKLYTKEHGYILSFFKFAILATFGECVALRIVDGRYWRPGFGLIAKAVMWGFIGLFLKACFAVFAVGSPAVLTSLGVNITAEDGFFARLLISFTTSVMLNTVFAPVLMILHKIYDDHIQVYEGKLVALIKPVDVAARFAAIDWENMWGFVLKKTVPIFWIPAQTVTFMLPPDMRIIFAAFLGGVLGVILAFASLKSRAV
ncbi:hypothetical protein [Desulfovibrio sp. JC010]|uniref:hypothetical protein n=1 Tax=Desulfovibrio sp. JC010 TaxID=2593641 RepID=UPI0013D18EAC|nr:hypothetical protein [Desulfovibrio sp. JC010]NDV25907.1 hypothetical protein [Desulfovibrio sp. JC010]